MRCGGGIHTKFIRVSSTFNGRVLLLFKIQTIKNQGLSLCAGFGAFASQDDFFKDLVRKYLPKSMIFVKVDFILIMKDKKQAPACVVLRSQDESYWIRDVCCSTTLDVS